MTQDDNSELLGALGSALAEGSLADESLLDSTQAIPPVSILPDANVVKIGGQSMLDRGRGAVIPLIDALAAALAERKLILATGGGARSRHLLSIGTDPGLPTGVLAQLTAADALGNAHLLDRFQIINGLRPELLAPVLAGEHVGTWVAAEPCG